MTKKITGYQKDLIEALKDPREAAAYLNAAIEDGDKEVFLLAMRNVAQAHGGMSAVAKKARPVKPVTSFRLSRIYSEIVSLAAKQASFIACRHNTIRTQSHDSTCFAMQ